MGFIIPHGGEPVSYMLPSPYGRGRAAASYPGVRGGGSLVEALSEGNRNKVPPSEIPFDTPPWSAAVVSGPRGEPRPKSF